jgi:hypothetical protein
VNYFGQQLLVKGQFLKEAEQRFVLRTGLGGGP